MRILSIDTYYPAFLDAVYAEDTGLGSREYDEQWRELMSRGFGVADFYSSNLRQLGHVATEVVPNCVPLQESWYRERFGSGAALPGEPGGADRLGRILVAQIDAFAPDVVHVQDCINLPASLIRELRKPERIISGQIACAVPETLDLSPYDLIVSSMPQLVARFRAGGLRAESLRLGFESTLATRIATKRGRQGAVFVGGVSAEHTVRLRLLEHLASERLIEWWGYGAESLPPGSPLLGVHRGPAWGLRMYELLANALIGVNAHIDAAGDHANNMRLYEVTGMGALLLTDLKSDLAELFEPGVEIETFSDPEECAAVIQRRLAEPAGAAEIGERGRRRTLSEHTYLARMRDLVALFETLL